MRIAIGVLLNSFHCHFPCNGILIERAEDNAALAFQ